MTNKIGEVRLSELDDALVHYGVKGMRWGQRKSPRHSQTRDYNSRDRLTDVGKYGEGGTKRIETHVQGGKTIGQARRKETRRQYGMGAAFIAGYAAVTVGPGLLKFGVAALNNQKNANFAANAAAKAATEAFINSHGLTSYKTLVL